jgi:hypothetical protein
VPESVCTRRLAGVAIDGRSEPACDWRAFELRVDAERGCAIKKRSKTKWMDIAEQLKLERRCFFGLERLRVDATELD